MTASILDKKDAEALTRKAKLRVGTGDVYLKEAYVYRVAAYNDTDDKVLLCTTNDPVLDYGWIRRIELRKLGFCLCPLELLHPAIQVFELDDHLSPNSLGALLRYGTAQKDLYDSLRMEQILDEVDIDQVRQYRVPEEQSQQYPNLKDKVFTLPYPFYCLSRFNAIERYKRRLRSPITFKIIKKMMASAKWPVIYVAKRYR